MNRTKLTEPQLHVTEFSEDKTNKDDSTLELQQHAGFQQEETDAKNGSDDDMEDDLLLREQLLQSLATKRAEKARAIMAVSEAYDYVLLHLYFSDIYWCTHCIFICYMTCSVKRSL